MLYLSGIIIAFFLAFILLVKQQKTAADYVLAAWLAVTGFHLFAYYLFLTGQYKQFPFITSMGFPLPLAQGPFLYIYTRIQTSPAGFKRAQLLHFIPILASYIMFGQFFLMSKEEMVAVYEHEGVPFQTQSFLNLIAVYISGVVYVGLSLFTLLRFRKQMVNEFSNTEKISFNWLLYLILWMALIWIVILFIQEDPLIFGAAVFFVVWIGYYGIRQVQVFHHHKYLHHAIKTGTETIVEIPATDISNPTGDKYQKSSLTEHEAKQIHERLIQILDEQHVYTDPELTLSELADMLEVHPNHLSQVINSIENKNFYDLINEKRIRGFISMLKQESSKQYTLLALAFASGFNSKASFNRNFKKITGLTPSEFDKQSALK